MPIFILCKILLEKIKGELVMNLLEATALALQNKLNEEFVDDEVFDKIDVYKICMDTYTGKRLYLAQTNTNIKHWKEAKTYEWVFDPNIAMQFNWEKEAEDFAKKYFKNFRGWYIRKEYTYA